MIHRLEELSANSWPGLRTVLVDGWIMRFAEGYSRRANCVLTQAHGVLGVEERIARCEAFARSRGVELVFKITPVTKPEGLDSLLEERGFERQSGASVMVLDSIPGACPRIPKGMTMDAFEDLEPGWMEFFSRTGGLSERQTSAARRIMEHIVPLRRFVFLHVGQEPAACALTVVEGDWAGVFDVAVRQDLRGQGLGRKLMEMVHREARQLGGAQAYLQVAHGNEVAKSLYRSLGYREGYDYWYRTKRVDA